jgi:MFS family permease
MAGSSIVASAARDHTPPAAREDMTDPKLSRRIELTGWSTVLLGVVCVVLALIQAVAPILLRRLAAELGVDDDSMRAMREVLAAGAGISAAVNGLFGAALIVIGMAVSRRARWAHRALLIACWSSIGALALLAKPTLAPFFAMAGGKTTGGLGMLVASAGLIVAQIVGVLWFLRFWNRPEVRAAFR